MRTKKWPVREPFSPMVTVEAPSNFVETDAVQIEVTITPMRNNVPLDKIFSRTWIADIEARDMRATQYILQQMVDHAMRVWNRGSNE